MEKETLSQRIKDYRKLHRVSAAAFAAMIRVDGAVVKDTNVYKWEGGTKPSDYAIVAEIERILAGKTSDLSERHSGKLLTGSKPLRPFYDAPASAGDVDADLMPVTRPVGYIDTGDLFGDCDAAIRTRGNSMLSGYPSGTVLGINLDANRFIEPGELYVLETRSKRLFKRLYPSKKGDDFIECYSDNTDVFKDGPKAGQFFYPTFDVHKEDIVRKFNVVGSAREHANSLVLYRKPIKEANTERDIQTIDV